MNEQGRLRWFSITTKGNNVRFVKRHGQKYGFAEPYYNELGITVFSVKATDFENAKAKVKEAGMTHLPFFDKDKTK